MMVTVSAYSIALCKCLCSHQELLKTGEGLVRSVMSPFCIVPNTESEYQLGTECNVTMLHVINAAIVIYIY